MVSRRKHGPVKLKGLGAKFGATVRKQYGMIQRTLKQKRKCPLCGSLKFDRIAVGIWYCPKCQYKVAGGAYDINIDKLRR